MRQIFATACMTLLVGASAVAQEAAPDLPIGDPARRDRHVAVVLDAITDTVAGDVLTPSDLAQRLDGVRVLFIGENHTSQAFHDVQLRVLQELQKRGRRMLVGLEMYPYTEQRWLDEWSSPARPLSEDEFLQRSGWYRNWGYNWNYYRDIFRFTREHGIHIYGVNVPRTVVQTARTRGLDALDGEARAYLPARIDLDSAEHKQLFRSYFETGGGPHTASMPEAEWDGLFRAQCTWDAAMGYGAVKALEKDGDPTTIAIVLIGSGHVAYDLGAERQAALWFKGRMASLIPVASVDESGQPTDPVRASYANFLWGILPETTPLYPVAGLSTAAQRDGGQFQVVDVFKGSPADIAGLEAGDVLISLDGVAIDAPETLNRLMSGKRWGDQAVYRIKRGSDEMSIKVLLRRTALRTETAP